MLIYFNANVILSLIFFFFFKQKTAYEMRISDWSSDVCSSDLLLRPAGARQFRGGREADSFGGMNRAETIHHRSFQSKGRGHDRFPHRTRIAGETRLDGDLRPRGMRADGHALPRSWRAL